jgi:hypothetical protein
MAIGVSVLGDLVDGASVGDVASFHESGTWVRLEEKSQGQRLGQSERGGGEDV